MEDTILCIAMGVPGKDDDMNEGYMTEPAPGNEYHQSRRSYGGRAVSFSFLQCKLLW
jgi:hypothetical protein